MTVGMQFRNSNRKVIEQSEENEEQTSKQKMAEDSNEGRR
jgi:hypothetical protein